MNSEPLLDYGRIAVVVLTWNGRADTLECLDSLATSTWKNLDVIVVDNGSHDGTEEALRQRGHDVAYIQNGANLGFAGGNNVGIAAAMERGADAVLVLNNDTVVSQDAVEMLAKALGSNPDAGACSPVLPYDPPRKELWFAGASYDPRRGRAGRATGIERGEVPLPRVPIDIDRAVGASMLVRRAVVHEVGAFSEDLFFLYEDVDWSLRMRAAGWRILLVPQACIPHKVAASQGGKPVSPTTTYYGTRNGLEMGRRHSGLHGVAAIRREIVCVAVHLASLRRAPSGTRSDCLRELIRGWRDFHRRRFGGR